MGGPSGQRYLEPTLQQSIIHKHTRQKPLCPYLRAVSTNTQRNAKSSWNYVLSGCVVLRCVELRVCGNRPSCAASIVIFAASSEAFAVMRCLCVCVSVTFVDHVKTNKRIFKIFPPSGIPTILVFTARCDASAVFAVTQCLSVCLSVTFVDHVKTNKDIFEIFFTIG